ncbi:hypothetical protein [Leptothrix discophora]|uniref:Uncharacterized protein n=1 Tax=Leptothrix discophora TaxID=89 RepID=A0ABT9G1L6_LEPDI|nr:hypothetical protein [Leptothrix discophora]MDP4300338.1 hypothetical protein [Leptothrix discophora]
MTTFIRPIDITSDVLADSTVGEVWPEWSAGGFASWVNYAAGTRVLRTGTRRVYECIVDVASATPPEDDAAHWLDIGPANRWAAFDRSVGTLTTAVGGMTFDFLPPACDSIALLDLQAARVEVDVYTDASAGELAYGRAIDLADRAGVSSWYDYLAVPIDLQSTVVLTDLPPLHGGRVTVRITAVSATSIAVGTCVLGTAVALGDTRTGASLGIVDYSRKKTDDYGVTDIVERPWSGRITVPVSMRREQVDAVSRALSLIRAKPVVWLIADDIDASVIYGFWTDWSITLSYPTHAEASITIQGLA